MTCASQTPQAPSPSRPTKLFPTVGNMVEVRFPYALAESGAIYQPLYLSPRHDILTKDCTVDQLKFKSQPTTV